LVRSSAVVGAAFDEKTMRAMASRVLKKRDASAERMRTALTKIVQGLESEASCYPWE
jgi:hypothetical protein